MRYLTIILALLISCTVSYAQSRTYTLDADFDEGTLVNVNHDAPGNDQLQLNKTTTPFPFVNIAASDRGTVVRIDVNTGDILGEYLTAPDGRGKSPSRTTVDLLGNVWVANRVEFSISGGVPKGSITRIGLVIGGTRGNKNPDGSFTPDPSGQYLQPPFDYNTCIDRDGDGLIKTSRGLGDILAWTNTGGVDNNGGVSTAEDECIINYTRVTGTGTRTVAIDANNDVWVGGLNNQEHEKVDGVTGLPVPGTQFNLGCGGYGGLLDGNGVLWSARGGDQLLRYDTNTMTGTCLPFSDNYGLGIDPNTGEIWSTTLSGNAVRKIDPNGTLLGSFTHGNNNAQGVAVDGNGNVWVAHSLFGATTVGHLRTDGTFVGNVPLPGGTGPTGVAIDANGKVWVANISTDNAMRIDPNAGAIGGGGFPIGQVDLVVNLGSGAGPYNYSDMTGFVSIGTTAPQGTWTVVFDGGSPGVEWGTVSWNQEPEGSEPAGTSIRVMVRAADAVAALPGETFVPVQNDAKFCGSGVAGQFIEIRTTLSRDPGLQDTPVLSELTIESCVAPPPFQCEVNITSPRDGAIVCDRRIEVEGTTTITGGVPPFKVTCDVNGTPATVRGTMFTATVPVSSRNNLLIATCTVVDSLGNQDICSDTIRVFLDDVPPTCAFTNDGLNVKGTFSDKHSGVAEIVPVKLKNATLTVGRFTPGAASVDFLLEPIDPDKPTGFSIDIFDVCGNRFNCDPVFLRLETSRPARQIDFTFPSADRYFQITNFGLTEVRIDLNGQKFKLTTDIVQASREPNTFLMFREGILTIDLGNYLQGEENAIFIAYDGSPGAAADLFLLDHVHDVDFILNLQTLPTAFRLAQNYPNPFNPTTRIRFDIPERLSEGVGVQLKIYNLLGKVVRTVVDEHKFPGQYIAEWDGRNDNGETVSSGIYIFQLAAGGEFRETKRMLLLK